MPHRAVRLEGKKIGRPEIQRMVQGGPEKGRKVFDYKLRARMRPFLW